MKAIELTEEHKYKLLEMCKVLFPETYTKTWDIKGLFDYEPIDDKNFKCFHWFEFCMVHLAGKLSDLSNVIEDFPPYVENVYPGANGVWNLYTKFHFHYPKACKGGSILPRNPIDYLYKEFKKLKL